MELQIVHRPAFTVVGVKYRGRNENGEIARMWETEFFPRLAEIKGRKGDHIFYGVEDNMDEATGEFDYVAAAEVESDAGTPEGMVRWTLPDQTYAVFPCTLRTIGETIGQAFSAWIPEAGYAYANTPMFEFYDESFMDGQKLYLYMPVVRK